MEGGCLHVVHYGTVHFGLVLAVFFPKRFAQTENAEQKKVTFLERRVFQITSCLLTHSCA